MNGFFLVPTGFGLKLIKYYLKKLILCHKLKFLIPVSLQLDGVNLWYFKLIIFNLSVFTVWNI